MPRAALYGPNWFPVALQALVILAESGEPCSSQSMAENLSAHAVFLRRVLAQLVRANLIQAREGRDGGYRLARPAECITLADIYQAVKSAEQPAAVAPCETDGADARVRTVLDEIGAETERQTLAMLGQITLAAVVARVANLTPDPLP